jgi:hypothetical protein
MNTDSSVMWQVPDLRFLWTLGAALLVLRGFGVAAAGTIVGLPLLLLTAAAGFSLEQGLKALAYTSPIWAPIGAGMGLSMPSLPLAVHSG